MDKLTIMSIKEPPSYKGCVRINETTHEILTNLSSETGLSFSALVNRIVKWAEPYIEVEV